MKMKGKQNFLDGDYLESYLQHVWEYPILSQEEEVQLISNFQNKNDSVAAEKLITCHLKLVVKIAMNAKNYGLPIPDLISEGSVGLLKALDRFEPTAGARLSTYATWWIKATINDYILKNWSMVPLGTINAQRRLFFSLKRIKRELGIYDNHDLSIEDALKIADKVDASVDEIQHINNRLQGRDLSLNTPLMVEETIEHQDQLQCDRVSAETYHAEEQQLNLRKDVFVQALDRLHERDREIIEDRYLREKPLPLKELASRYGISSERVRQLEVKALGTIQSFVKRHSLFGQLCLN